MTGRVFIRRYRLGDETAIRNIVDSGAMSTVLPFFMGTATREFVSQAILMLSAVLFIVIGTPLHYSLLSLPVTFLGLYFSIWVGHKLKACGTHGDIKNIKSVYMEDPRCGFWVAELISSEAAAKKTPKDTDYEFIREGDAVARKSDLSGGKIIGTIAICIKDDPDMKDPPGSVAWLRRMAVEKGHQRRGVGSALLEVALDHCGKSLFQAVELVTSEHHEKARSLYYKKGFELNASYKKMFLGGLVGLNMFRLQKKIGSKSNIEELDDMSED